MFHRKSAVFESLHDYIGTLPVIDTHEHMAGPALMPRVTEPIAALTADYVVDDLRTAGADAATLRMFADSDVPTQRKWEDFERIWKQTEHTTYARVTKLILQDVYNVEEMSFAGLQRVAEQLAGRDEAYYWRTLDEAGIRVVLSDVLGRPQSQLGAFLSGDLTFPEMWRMFIPLPLFHVISHYDWSARDWQGVQRIAAWANRHITSLDEFLEVTFDVFVQAKAKGAIGIKDQCAYNRTLDYDVVPRADAERIFNRLLTNPQTVFGYPDAKPLDDFLFHQYMRFARDLDLPVQLHTGHVAGGYNRVAKANVAHFATVLELHQDVRFDLFHGNYPYMGDILFFVKNYPNVTLNLCWLYIVDPFYAIELIKRAILTVPHSKVHGFGGDYEDYPEYSAAHLKIARQALAAALSDLVEEGWLNEEQARDIAADWLFHNPNRFFRLELDF